MIFERLHFEVTSATKCNCSDGELQKMATAALNDTFGGDFLKHVAELKVRERKGRWVAGWYDDRFSPSSASGDVGFFGDTPEEAVKKLLGYVLEIVKGEA